MTVNLFKSFICTNVNVTRHFPRFFCGIKQESLERINQIKFKTIGEVADRYPLNSPELNDGCNRLIDGKGCENISIEGITAIQRAWLCGMNQLSSPDALSCFHAFKQIDDHACRDNK